MALKDRISIIIKEHHMKQKDLAALMGVSESYISTLLSGRNQNVSATLANLIEEKLGYHAHWVMTGEEPKYKSLSQRPDISDTHRRLIMQIEKMSDSEVRAVLAFVDTLERLNQESGRK